MLAIFKIIITKFWPALIPALLYLIWLFYARKKAADKEKKPKLGEGPIILTVSSILIISLLCILYIFIDVYGESETYIPSHFEGNELVPSKVKSNAQ
ncbi:hypothetical protein N9W34_01700 [Rickettsiales bacterium]|nr:hypothetical protein [Rickettsiales bacterium]